MPREVIHDDAGKFDLVITWDAERYVQVGVQTRDGRSINEVLRDGSADLKDEELTYTGLWTTPNRWQINRTIQTLRRARNAVHGADE